MMIITCEMCHKQAYTYLTKVQTIPGSLDTKFVTMELCRDCSREYGGMLSDVWEKSVKKSPWDDDPAAKELPY